MHAKTNNNKHAILHLCIHVLFCVYTCIYYKGCFVHLAHYPQSTCEEKDEELEMANSKITKLQDEVARLREVIKCARSQEDQSPLMSRHNSHSHAHARPHSVHIDLSDRDEKLDSGESPNLAVTSTELSVRQQHIGNANNLNVKSSSRRAKNKEMATNNEEASSSQETENLNVADTGT